MLGVSDPGGEPIAITITGILRDEPVDTLGSGNSSPDGQGVGTGTAAVRAELVGGRNGRVYHTAFAAVDGDGSPCCGQVLVGAPQSENHAPVDDGPLYDSTVVMPYRETN